MLLRDTLCYCVAALLSLVVNIYRFVTRAELASISVWHQTIEMLAPQNATLCAYFSRERGTPLPPSSIPRLLRILKSKKIRQNSRV